MSTALRDSLASLHTTLVDSRNGYQEALEDSGPKGLTSLFEEMIASREQNAIALEPFVRASGAEPQIDGSFMSSVHRTVISIRSLFNDLDESILPGLIDGERRILSTYDEALKHATGDVRDELIRQRNDVVAKIAAMEQRARKAA